MLVWAISRVITTSLHNVYTNTDFANTSTTTTPGPSQIEIDQAEPGVSH